VRQQLEQEVRAGDEVKRLLEHPYLKEAFEAAENSILEQMDEVKLRDTEMHTRLIMAKQTLGAVKRYLSRIVETGEIAKLQLTEPNKIAGFFRR